MPRFFFDVYNGTVERDDEGSDFADPADARREAVRASGGILRDRPDTDLTQPWKMIVRDEDNGVVAMLTFSVT